MKHLQLVITLLLFTVLTGAAKSYKPEDVPNVHLQNRNQYVSDPDGYMSPEARAKVDARLRALTDSTTMEVAVVIVGDMGGMDVFDFSQKLASEWGIGQSDKDNGLLLLFAMDDRKVRIHTGKGVEGILPDIACKRIIEERIIPRIQGGDLDGAVEAGVDKIVQVATDPVAAKEIRSAQRPDANAEGPVSAPFKIFVLFMGAASLVLVVYYIIAASGKRDNYQSSSYLRSKMWIMVLMTVLSLGIGLVALLILVCMMKYFRNRPIKCDLCGAKMRKLPEDKDNDYLTPSQDLEEKLGSVDYDVWLCPQCNTTEIFPYVSKNTPYKKCPYCHTHALRLMHDRIEVRPTTMHKGRGVRIYHCENCGKDLNQPYDIPKSAPPVVVVGGIGGRGGGGGGGFSGGSFGGGGFGGGGAGGSW